MRAWSPCTNADALDFFLPHVSEHLATVGEVPRLHCKQWEYAQLLEVRRRLAPDAKRLVGLGCGCEGAEEITVTDLYEREGAWDVARVDPRKAFPSMENLRVHSMDMRKIDLPERSADFVWSLCAVEHVGSLYDVIETVRQAASLLTDDGKLFISTELNLSGSYYRTKTTLYLTVDMIEKIVRNSGLYPVAPIRIALSSHPMNTPVEAKVNDEHGAIPHIIYRHQQRPGDGIFATVVSFVLSRHDHGHPIVEVDPELETTLRALGTEGRRLNRRLVPPWKWW